MKIVREGLHRILQRGSEEKVAGGRSGNGGREAKRRRRKYRPLLDNMLSDRSRNSRRGPDELVLERSDTLLLSLGRTEAQ